MSARYLIVLAITVDDPENDDPRNWNYDGLLAAPEGEAERFVSYVTGAKEADADAS